MIPVARKEFGKKGWFFQYGRWDIRVDCPVCQKSEAFMFSCRWITLEGITEDPGMCPECGFLGPLKLEGFTKDEIDKADYKERHKYDIFGDSTRAVNHDWNDPSRKFPTRKFKEI